MNNYFLTDTAKSILYDRTRRFSEPVMFSSSTDYTAAQLAGKSNIATIRTYAVNCYKLHDKLLFVVNLPLDAFSENYMSFIIGFNKDLSRESNSDTFKQLFYINSANCYGGITAATGEEGIIQARLRVSQLKYGVNTIIIPDVFPCSFEVETLENDLPNNANTWEQLRDMYPYYETL